MRHGPVGFEGLTSAEGFVQIATLSDQRAGRKVEITSSARRERAGATIHPPGAASHQLSGANHDLPRAEGRIIIRGDGRTDVAFTAPPSAEGGDCASLLACVERRRRPVGDYTSRARQRTMVIMTRFAFS